jgi:pyruvate kinase
MTMELWVRFAKTLSRIVIIATQLLGPVLNYTIPKRLVA